MGTITQRVRKDGSIGYTAQVRLSQGSAVVFNMAHLSPVFSIAQPAWGYPLNEQAMADACKVLGKLGGISRSKRQ
jgi:hypothetical protein